MCIRDSAQAVQRALGRLAIIVFRHGMCFEPSKSKVLPQNWRQLAPALALCGDRLEIVKYLGSLITWPRCLGRGQLRNCESHRSSREPTARVAQPRHPNFPQGKGAQFVMFSFMVARPGPPAMRIRAAFCVRPPMFPNHC